MTTRMTKTMKVMITPHLGRLGSSRYLRHLPPSPRRNPDFHLIHDVGGMKLLVGIPHSLQARGAVFVTMKQEDRATLLLWSTLSPRCQTSWRHEGLQRTPRFV